MKDVAETAATILERVVTGALDPVLALQLWPEWVDADDRLLEIARRDLALYAAETDLRERRPAYRSYQDARLLKRAAEIRRTARHR